MKNVKLFMHMMLWSRNQIYMWNLENGKSFSELEHYDKIMCKVHDFASSMIAVTDCKFESGKPLNIDCYKDLKQVGSHFDIIFKYLEIVRNDLNKEYVIMVPLLDRVISEITKMQYYMKSRGYEKTVVKKETKEVKDTSKKEDNTDDKDEESPIDKLINRFKK